MKRTQSASVTGSPARRLRALGTSALLLAIALPTAWAASGSDQ